MKNQENEDHSWLHDIHSPKIQQFITNRISELRKKLLDLSRRNPLLNTHFRHNSTSILRVVDELPDVLRFNLANGKKMRLVPLPALEEELPDEKTKQFLDALYIARKEDPQYLSDIELANSSSEDSEEILLEIERKLKDRIREQLRLAPRQTKENPSIIQHAKIHGIDPSYILPLPQEENADGRHNDKKIQTLMLPDRLIRVAKGIFDKSHSFERETGVNVLNASFGFLEWKSPDESKPFLSPLLLQEIRIERKQSPQGAQFLITGLDSVFVNTALALKLSVDYELLIPQYDNCNVEEYFDRIKNSAPKGWDWKVRREVAFGIFPSSKIAMYHDLDPELRPIAANNVVARLMGSTGSGDGSYAEIYETDNPEVKKKVPYIIADADASQYSVLVDVANGKNISIEGPPGSGKSQSIVNLIAAAIVDGKKVLFVAEKLTALDIVKNRLEAATLGGFILPLQAGRGTREKIYESLLNRLKIDHLPTHTHEDFRKKQNVLEKCRAILQRYLDIIALPFGDTGMTVYQVIGRGISSAEILSTLPKKIRRIKLQNVERVNLEDVEQLVQDVDAFADHLGKIHRIPRFWLVSNAAILNHDEAEDASDDASQLAKDMECFAEDFMDSGLSPFLASDPFSIDIVELSRLLHAILDAEKMDSMLVENLTSEKCRQDVQMLCEQIKEYRSFKSHLASILKDSEGWNIVKKIEAARKFAADNGGYLAPQNHHNRIRELEEQISNSDELIRQAKALPVGWTNQIGTTLRSISHDAQKIMAFPESVRAIRRRDESNNAAQLATEIIDTLHLLKSELVKIRQALPRATNDNTVHVRLKVRIIARSGIFRFLSKEYKSARNYYCNTLGGSHKEDREIMAWRLETYANWLDKKNMFENDTRFNQVFGDLFKGIATSHEDILRLSMFYSCCQNIANDDSMLQQVLETGDLTPIETFSLADNVPGLSLSELENARENLARLLNAEKMILKEAISHADIFKMADRLELAEIERVIDHYYRQRELNDLIKSSEAADALGPRFSGIETRIDILQDACIKADTLNDMPDPLVAISILRSGTAQQLLEKLNDYQTRYQKIEKNAANLWTHLKLPEELRSLSALYAWIPDIKAAAEDPDSLIDRTYLKKCEDTLRTQGLEILVEWVKQETDTFEPSRLGSIVRAIIEKNMVDCIFQLHTDVLQEYNGQEFNRIRKSIATTDRALIEMSRDIIRNKLLVSAQPPSGNNIGKKSTFTDLSLLHNELRKKRNRIGVRELTRRAGMALLELKPCWMMSPLAVAQYLHDGIEFDLVVVDEASQMTPENAIGALSRGRQAVIVGDTKQLPPTSFFQKMLDDSDMDDDLHDDSESILDMANVAFMPIRQLRWHYRSRHSELIQFSNQIMYRGELTIFPSAQERHHDLGVDIIEVSGVYKSQRNIIEAERVVLAAIRHMESKPDQSLGICTMNISQKELILEEFERERDRNPNVQKYIDYWERGERWS